MMSSLYAHRNGIVYIRTCRVADFPNDVHSRCLTCVCVSAVYT